MPDSLDDVREVVTGYLAPAMIGLREAADAGDVHAIRAYALEISLVAGSVVAAVGPVREPRVERGAERRFATRFRR